MNYEEFKGRTTYANNIIGKPVEVSVTIRMDAETHHYIKYLAMINRESVAKTYNEVMKKHVDAVKSRQ